MSTSPQSTLLHIASSGFTETQPTNLNIHISCTCSIDCDAFYLALFDELSSKYEHSNMALIVECRCFEGAKTIYWACVPFLLN